MAELAILKDTAVQNSPLHEARWWEPEPGNRVHCFLCPRHCRIHEGQSGFCFIRVNRGGKLYSLGYGSPAALQVDPIEKKPLNHFLPGTRVFSMGTAGCNMGCFFCQNWTSPSRATIKFTHNRFRPKKFLCLRANTIALRSRLPTTSRRSGANTLWTFAPRQKRMD